MDDRLPDAPKPKPAQHAAVAVGRPDGTPPQCHAESLLVGISCSRRLFSPHSQTVALSSCFSAVLRRKRRTSSGCLNCVRPFNVARTALNGLPRPSVFAITL